MMTCLQVKWTAARISFEKNGQTSGIENSSRNLIIREISVARLVSKDITLLC